ncbi:MAG: hypothetical protein K9K86_11050, partial [Pseudomonadales bacterium]|nr:hypothetical protein [Pseudomonadales bacterium]
MNAEHNFRYLDIEYCLKSNFDYHKVIGFSSDSKQIPSFTGDFLQPKSLSNEVLITALSGNIIYRSYDSGKNW